MTKNDYNISNIPLVNLTCVIIGNLSPPFLQQLYALIIEQKVKARNENLYRILYECDCKGLTLQVIFQTLLEIAQDFGECNMKKIPGIYIYRS